MGLYNNRLISLALVGLLGVAAAGCEDSTTATQPDQQQDDETAQQQDGDEVVDLPQADEPSFDFEQADEEQIEQFDAEDLPFFAVGPVAEIDGEEISEEEFNEMVREQTEQMPDLPPQMVQMAMQQSISFVVDKHLIDGVLDEQDIEVTDEEIDEQYEEFLRRFGGDEEMARQQMSQFGMSEDELRDRMRENVELEKYLGERYDLEVTDEDVQEFYDQNEQRFAQPEQVEASHILIEVDEDADESSVEEARQRAEEVYEEAVGGADFAQLAEERSEGPTARRGGELGSFSRGDMVQEFSEAAFDELDPGDISEPVRTEFGYHVIKKTDHVEEGQVELAEVEDDIEMQLVSQTRQEAFQEFMEELKGETDIEEHPDNIVANVEIPDEPQQPPMMPHGQPGQGQPQPQQPQIEIDEDISEELRLEQPDPTE